MKDNALTESNTLNSGECGLTDGSDVGDWRLPNVKELQSLIDYGDISMFGGFETRVFAEDDQIEQ